MSEKNNYLEILKSYAAQGPYPLAMPGHKRNRALFGQDLPYDLDVTEVEGLWDLHHPDTELRKKMQDLAQALGTNRSFFLTSGSTVGILSALHAMAARGSEILLERHAHLSVYHALELLDLVPHYLKPHYWHAFPLPASPGEIAQALAQHPKISTLVLTSPSYRGQRAQLSKIAALCREKGVHLLVDQAHGAHLRLLDLEDGVKAGADMVVESLHKTLPALTPAALVHCQNPDFSQSLDRYLHFFETSSPSHLIAASIDFCLDFLRKEGRRRAQDLLAWREKADGFFSSFQALKILERKDPLEPSADPWKINLAAPGYLTGGQLASRLRQAGFEVELSDADSVLLLLGLGDALPALDRFLEAAKKLDQELFQKTKDPERVERKETPLFVEGLLPNRVLGPGKARLLPGKRILLQDALGRVSKENLWAYPPGSPLLVAGEVIDQETLDLLEKLSDGGISLHVDSWPSGSSFSLLSIEVVAEPPA